MHDLFHEHVAYFYYIENSCNFLLDNNVLLTLVLSQSKSQIKVIGESMTKFFHPVRIPN